MHFRGVDRFHAGKIQRTAGKESCRNRHVPAKKPLCIPCELGPPKGLELRRVLPLSGCRQPLHQLKDVLLVALCLEGVILCAPQLALHDVQL